MLIKDEMASESTTTDDLHRSEENNSQRSYQRKTDIDLKENLQKNTETDLKESLLKNNENLTFNRNNAIDSQVKNDDAEKLNDLKNENETESQEDSSSKNENEDSPSTFNNEISFKPNTDEDPSEMDPLNSQDSAPADKYSVQVSFIIYLSRGLSAWGDRLWAFGIGIFMNLLGPKDLRLVAVYGFSTSISVIFIGATIGRWIDRTERLTSAKTFLGIQNLVCNLV